MKFILFTLFLFSLTANKLFSQNTLFDDTRISSVYIELPPDSLAVIMTDVLSDHYFKAMFIYDSGAALDTLLDVGFRLRGNTSRFSQKKSFKISFNEYVAGRKYQGVKKLNLNGQHNDPTMVREKLFYDVWNKAGMATRRTSFVRMYINHVYYGLYTNLEEFDKEWLQRTYGENDGNLYKCTYPADLVYLGTNQQTYKNIPSGASTGGRAYELQTNETQDDYSDLVDLITILNLPADSNFEVQVAQKINIDNLLKAFAIDVATGNWDDYMYNKNNYFLYHRSDTDKFEFISYDTDNTFGVDWVNRDWATRNCLDWYSHSEARPLVTKLLEVPAFMTKYQLYLDTIARTLINPEIVFQHIDSLETIITDAAIADTFRSLDYGYTVADFHNGFTQTIDGHTPYGIKPFLTKRFSTMLQQLSTASVPEIDKSNQHVFIFPNPVGNILNMSILPVNTESEVSIFDVTGRQLKSFVLEANKSETEISVNELMPGLYLLVLVNSGYRISEKFIKN